MIKKIICYRAWDRKFIFLFLLLSSILYAMPHNNELSQVTGQIQQLQKNIIADHLQQERLEHELESIETAINKLDQQVRTLNIAIHKEQSQIDQLKKFQQTALNNLNHQQTALSQQLRAIYPLSQMDFFKVLLNQDNPNTLQRHIIYYGYLLQTRTQLIFSIKHSLEFLKSNLKEIALHQHNLKMLLNKKELQHEQEQNAQNQRLKLLNQSKYQVKSKEEQLINLMANQKALYNIIARLRKQTPVSLSHLSFNHLRGKLQWPVNGAITVDFGSMLDVGDQRFNGVLIKALQDTPVRAIYSGKVIFANWLRGFGLLIIINHGQNFMSLYGRNHTLLAQVGNQVNTGDVIATTGNSGGFDKTQLYFEIRENGIPLNPHIWCH